MSDDASYQLEITPASHLGWYVRVYDGPMKSGLGWALTRKGVEHKGRRWVARLRREDARAAQQETIRIPAKEA